MSNRWGQEHAKHRVDLKPRWQSVMWKKEEQLWGGYRERWWNNPTENEEKNGDLPSLASWRCSHSAGEGSVVFMGGWSKAEAAHALCLCAPPAAGDYTVVFGALKQSRRLWILCNNHTHTHTRRHSTQPGNSAINSEQTKEEGKAHDGP